MFTFFFKSKIHVLFVRFICLKIIQTHADLLFQRILFADCSIDVSDKHLVMALTWLSWFPFLISYGEPKTLFYQIILFGPKSTNGRHFLQKKIFSELRNFYIEAHKKKNVTLGNID